MELCLSPDWGTDPWFHFIVNLNRRLLDARMFDRDWDPPQDWRVQSRAEGEKWVLDVGVPFEALELDAAEAGLTCALKLSRYRAKDEILIWPPLGSEAEGGCYVTRTTEPTQYARLVLQ